MFKQRIIKMLAVAVLATVAWTNDASATFFTTNGEWQLNSPSFVGPPTLSPLTDPKGILDGKSWTNTYVTATGEVRVRTIFSSQITTIRNGGSISPIAGTGNELNIVNVVAALDGKIIQFGTAGNPATVLFEQGRAAIVESGVQYNGNDPTTWGFGTAAAPGTEAEWMLAPAQDVLPGSTTSNTSAQFTFGANTVNTSTVNTEVASQNQARILFMEDSVDPNDPGDGFVNTVIDQANISPGLQAAIDLGVIDLNDRQEGLIVVPRQTNFENPDQASLDNAAFQQVLNDLGIWAGLDDVGDVAGENFADFDFSGGAGNPNGFIIDNIGGPIGDPLLAFETGDFIASGQTEIAPGLKGAIPEPTTALLGLMGLAGIGLRRRRNA